MGSVRLAFANQADACEGLGSPFTASLCRSLGRHLTLDLAVGKMCLDWQGDPGPSADSIPLRLCGGLHALVISGRDKNLATVYPPHSAVAPAWPLIESALVEHEEFLLDWMQSPPQTNEVSRAAVVWSALMTVAGQTKKPIRLLEVGASGGLNLNMDRFAYQLGSVRTGPPESLLFLSPQWEGKDPVYAPVNIESRAGCDINPLDVNDPNDVLRLRSYCWPDQTDRTKRLNAALEIAASSDGSVDHCDAIKWLDQKLSVSKNGICTVIYSTIAWQYLPKESRDEGEKLIRGFAKAHASTDTPLAWIRFEADAETPGAGIRLQLWPIDEDVQLGRADFHGRWVNWFGFER